jgi:hypothetical protein
VKLRRSGLVFLALAALGTDPALLACGDKFLVAGRGARFQKGGSHKLVVVIYARPASSLAAGAAASFDKTLRRAGYHPTVASAPEELERTLKENPPGLVLADLADAGSVGKLVPSGAMAPAVVPVLANASSRELAEARRSWGVALKANAGSDSLLDAVADAIERRAKSARPVERPL